MAGVAQGEPLAGRRRLPRSAGRRLLPGLVAAVTVIGLRVSVAEPLGIAGTSMAPTLGSGDHVLVERVSRVTAWRRGDVLAFRAPGGVLMVKRLAGLPGDRVSMRDGLLVVNGGQVVEPYVDHGAVDGVYYGPVRVPAGHVLMLGDNRGDSIDSRRFGPVPNSSVHGRVVMVLWPPSRLGTDLEGGAP